MTLTPMTLQIIPYKTVTVKRSYNRWIRCIALIGMIIGCETLFVLVTSAYLYQSNHTRIIDESQSNVTDSGKTADEFIQDFFQSCDNMTTTEATPIDGSDNMCPCVSPDLRKYDI